MSAATPSDNSAAENAAAEDFPIKAAPQAKGRNALTGNCTNCGAELQGPFCHQCGQEDKNYIRNVFRLITELFGEMGNWDGRFWRTLIPLFIRPGFLSKQYVTGKRIAYVPPLRLYIFISLIAFILFSSLGNGFQQLDSQLASQGQVIFADETEGKAPAVVSEFQFNDVNLNFGFLSEADNETLNAKLQFLREHPRVFMDRFFSLAPQLMLVMLPLFALVLKLLYAFSGRYYVEHLVLALHTHAFILLSLMVIMGVNSVMGLALPIWMANIVSWVYTLLWWWIPIYLFLTQKRFYRQGWGMTTVKFTITSLLYFVVLALMLFATIILSVLRA